MLFSFLGMLFLNKPKAQTLSLKVHLWVPQLHFVICQVLLEMEEEGFEYAREIKQKFDPSQKNAVIDTNDLPLEGQHPGYQSEQGTRDPLTVLQNFQGASIQEGQALPPDPTGAVGQIIMFML